MHLQANHAPRVTPCNLPKPRPHKECEFQTIATPVKRKHQPRTRSFHTQPWQCFASCGCVGCNQRPAQKFQARTMLGIQRFDQTENQQFIIQDPPKPQYDHKRSPHRCTSACVCSASRRRALSSIRSKVGASLITRDTGYQVLSTSSSLPQATLKSNSSPLAARLIAEMPRIWYSPWFSNCWKTLRSSPVISTWSSA